MLWLEFRLRVPATKNITIFAKIPSQAPARALQSNPQNWPQLPIKWSSDLVFLISNLDQMNNTGIWIEINGKLMSFLPTDCSVPLYVTLAFTAVRLTDGASKCGSLCHRAHNITAADSTCPSVFYDNSGVLRPNKNPVVRAASTDASLPATTGAPYLPGGIRHPMISYGPSHKNSTQKAKIEAAAMLTVIGMTSTTVNRPQSATPTLTTPRPTIISSPFTSAGASTSGAATSGAAGGKPIVSTFPQTVPRPIPRKPTLP